MEISEKTILFFMIILENARIANRTHPIDQSDDFVACTNNAL